MSTLIDFTLHIDVHLANLVSHFGIWTYLILFAIILVETGAVVLPFLPGDSLLFAAGAISMTPAGKEAGLNHWVFMILFFIAPMIGDTVNYWIARTGGRELLHHRPFSFMVKPKHIDEADAFFQKHGSMAVILGRYIPIVRTFVPFVAGLSEFNFRKFVEYTAIAAFSWSFIATGAGALFGNIPFVREHFSLIIMGIVVVTLLPSIIAVLRSIFSKKKQK
ncbi:DedA family protein [Fructobacillus pseudoficulneus]|uniref:DedA family protein n=1 Tax=Fructobacillus pseudoficulneus TaxID=220714 RepID=A0A3F3H8P9_9LACO|nr:VTT domain-containing protein [Fructobacillus pseudoficulneus]GAP02703.1 DedA family protein [Fructobacillus pseudoficulneus]SEH39227.1 membrane-associated protein [Fructobacillus pseudoficulneus]